MAANLKTSPIGFAIPIARFTLLESLRSRTLMLALWMAAGGLAVAAFIGQVALTESNQLQAAIIAALLRVCAVFLLATFIVSSIVREYADKVIELVLSQALPRSSYVLGKLIGFVLTALLLAAIFALPLLLFAPGARVALWGASLAVELTLVAALALFCVLTLANVVTALVVVAGFYVLSRTFGAIRVIATGTADSTAPGDIVLRHSTEWLAWILPQLDRFTQSAWLTDPVLDVSGLGLALAHVGTTLLLLLAATMFDFYRQNF